MIGCKSFTLSLLLRLAAGIEAVSPNLTVDVGYAIYQGYQQAGYNNWNGMRYAQPPLGNLRWQAPTTPATDRSSVMQANAFGNQCPQAPQSPAPAGYNGDNGNEDCLFLNVQAPVGANKLPVVFNIHGGGYGAGNGDFNASSYQLENITNNGFVLVSIQYRLEAFGFLASPDIHANGSLNAGLLDQHFALQWVNKYISMFGGDPTKVTLIGQSAGAGSILMQMMAYGGTDGTKYFQQGIAASPYTPAVNNYSDPTPINRYNRFAAAAGCGSASNVLACLRAADTSALQMANAKVGSNVNYGSWGFTSVLDGTFIQQRPSQQLPLGHLNGQGILVSSNANEGAQFVNPNITNTANFTTWLKTEFPLLNNSIIQQIENTYYPLKDVGNVTYASCGDCGGPRAVNVGSFATGNEQRALDLYSEVTFDCPAYWLAEGMTAKGGKGYKYEFSVIPATHGLDIPADGFGSCDTIFTPQLGPDFCTALSNVWAAFIINGNPDIPNSIANGNVSNPNVPNAASNWPLFSATGSAPYQMINFNQTGGLLIEAGPLVSGFNQTAEYVKPGLKNNLTQVNAYNWEGGRGARCDFWRKLGYPS